MKWQIDLIGQQLDIDELMKLAPLCGCTIEMGPDGRQCLTYVKPDAFTEWKEVRAQAEKTLMLLNGLARMNYGNHRPVRLGVAVSRVGPDDQRSVSVTLEGIELRARVAIGLLVTRADGSTERVVDKTPAQAQRIAAEPNLVGVVEALGEDITWQKLRVAFEKFTALVGRGDNALVKQGYATQDELDTFKANVQDPRHSGLSAVHGVPRGALKGAKMTEQEGLAFVVRMFRNYLDRLPLPGEE